MKGQGAMPPLQRSCLCMTWDCKKCRSCSASVFVPLLQCDALRPSVFELGSQILVLRPPQSLHAPAQNSKDLEKSTNSCDHSTRKATGDHQSYRLNLCCVPPLKSSRDSYTLVSTQSSTHCSLGSRRAFDTGGRPYSPCWRRTSRIAFRLRRPELCLSTSQQPTTLYGTAASPANCCDCCLRDTWSAW